MTKLYVVQGNYIKGESLGGYGVYYLVSVDLHKAENKPMWSHMCSNANWAMNDLQYPSRKKFLDDFFGEHEWEFVLDLEGNIFDNIDSLEDEDIDAKALKIALDEYNERDEL